MYTSTSSTQFLDLFTQELDLHITQRDGIRFLQQRNTKQGIYQYGISGLYVFTIADYTIPHHFSIRFDHEECLLRFGLVQNGSTSVQLQDKLPCTQQPAAFLIREEQPCGIQTWEPNEHLQGMEFTLYPAFLNQLHQRGYSISLHEQLIVNHTYHYLPAQLYPIFYELKRLHEQRTLTALYTEGALLQCLSVLEKEYVQQEGLCLRQMDYGVIRLGDRTIRLQEHDYKAIQQAHRLLQEQISDPPTIHALSRTLLIDEQKLKAGFRYYYHMSIREFSISVKMTHAAALLCTSELSVQEIAERVGYRYPSSFIQTFSKLYHCTPLQFRQREKSKQIHTNKSQ
ncbi:AraC family transcriptional regulator [[Clostridium] innocuum]|nr:AraC family transcriptional regulator [[Clostridium] innocuum]